MKEYIYVLGAWNIIVFMLYGIDKRKAKRHEWRISEKILITAAFLFGSLGAMLGMLFFHHKTKKVRIFMLNLIKKIKDPVSCLTHMAGAILSVIGLVFLVVMAAKTKTPWHIVGFSIFGASLILLYTASTVYHMLNISDKVNLILRKIDHMMIFVLIAGTYTPICLTVLRGIWGWVILSIVWTIAISGIFLKGFWMNAPRWLSTGIYLVMGWIVVIAIYPLSKTMHPAGLALLAVGGAMYTIGAVIYGLKWPKINFKHFGFHEIFHLFVLAGSLSHFFMMYFQV